MECSGLRHLQVYADIIALYELLKSYWTTGVAAYSLGRCSEVPMQLCPGADRDVAFLIFLPQPMGRISHGQSRGHLQNVSSYNKVLWGITMFNRTISLIFCIQQSQRILHFLACLIATAGSRNSVQVAWKHLNFLFSVLGLLLLLKRVPYNEIGYTFSTYPLSR